MSPEIRGRMRALFAGTLASLLLLEILLRLLAGFPWSTADFVSDPQIGFRQRPGVVIAGQTTNSRGFNAFEPAAEKRERRIGIVGDSFVFAAVPRGLDLVSRLAAAARREAQVEMINMGVLAAGPESYLGLLERDGRELQLDAALVVFFVGNDISQADPHFKTRIFFGAPRAVLRSPFFVRPGIDYLYSIKMLRGGWRLFREEVLYPKEPGGTFSRRIFLEVERDRLEICRKVPGPKIARGYEGAFAFFDRLRRFESERGIPVAVAIAPDQLQVDRELQAALFSPELLGPEAAGAFDLELPQRRLAAALEARGIRHVDLLPRMRNRAAERQLYLERDSHWNADGNRLAATFLLDAFRSWGWLDTPPAAPLDSPSQAH